MAGHYHNPSAATQNQQNVLGNRSCVRQSKFFRQYESGNSMKGLLGNSNLGWKTDVKEGVYSGQAIYDFNRFSRSGGASEIVSKYSDRVITKSTYADETSYKAQYASREYRDVERNYQHFNSSPCAYEGSERAPRRLGKAGKDAVGYSGKPTGECYSGLAIARTAVEPGQLKTQGYCTTRLW